MDAFRAGGIANPIEVKGERFIIPKPARLAKEVDLLAEIPAAIAPRLATSAQADAISPVAPRSTVGYPLPS